MAKETNWFTKHGVEVAENGWPIVLLRHKGKKPINNDWVKVEWTPGKIKTLVAEKRKFGIGIKCGNVICLDNDYEVEGPVTLEFIESIVELQKHYFPDVMLRRGRPTRQPSQIFILEGGETYRSLNIDKFQLLGRGRQFVAYNEHPDTGKPFKWLRNEDGELRSPANLLYDAAPAYDKDTLTEFLESLAILIDAWGFGGKAANDALERIKDGDRTPGELRGDQKLMEEAAKWLTDPEEWGWEDWNNNIMMPMWAASGGEEWGRDLCHEICRENSQYDEKVLDERWDQITKSPPTRKGAGSILWQAYRNGMPRPGQREWDSYVLFEDRDEVFNTANGHWVTEKKFNLIFNRKAKKARTPMQIFLEEDLERLHDSLTWDPSLPYGSTRDELNHKVWNTCRLPDDFGEEGDIGPWMELMENLYEPQDLKIMLKRMAFDVQYPHLKPQWHELFIGQHGAGKNLKQVPLLFHFGERRLGASVNASVMEESFNDAIAKRKYLEMVEPNTVTNKVFNKWKDILATQAQWITINEKYAKKYMARNVLSIYFSSNEISAISLANDERRLYVIHKTTKMLPLKLQVKIFKWLREEGGWKHVIYHLKHEVSVKENYGNTLPRFTEAAADLVKVTGLEHDRLREYIMQATEGVVVFNLEDLLHHMHEHGVEDRRGQLLHRTTLMKALHNARAIRVAGGNVVRLNGERMRLWSFDNELKHATADQVRTAYMISGGFKQILMD